ncbi:MAG: HAD family hydrolase [Clostridia bacterium]|nr:HAD family hydrolase [Clostridia bacterium]
MEKNIWRIVFDYDGTLISHSHDKEAKIIADYLNIENTKEFQFELHSFYDWMNYYFKNKIVTSELYKELICTTLPILKSKNISIDKFLEAQAYKDNYHVELATGACEILEYLKSKGYYLCIFTNGFYEGQTQSMKHRGILDYFDKVYGWDNFYPKPDGRAFRRVLDGTNPHENAMIGDNVLADIVPAKRIGMTTFALNFEAWQKKYVIPDVALESLLDLKYYL